MKHSESDNYNRLVAGFRKTYRQIRKYANITLYLRETGWQRVG